MALSKLFSAAINGIEARTVCVEVDISSGLPNFAVVGLADKAVEEAKERVRSAIKHSGYSFPIARITVNLSPSELKKTGVHYDLAIALGILLADGQIKSEIETDAYCFFGGLHLDGSLQGFPGALSMVEVVSKKDISAVVPVENLLELNLLEKGTLIGISNLSEAVSLLTGQEIPQKKEIEKKLVTSDFSGDWLQIRGQEKAKRMAVVAAAGGHNILLVGPPGSGKTLLARGIRSLLPPLHKDELLEVVKLHSVAQSSELNMIISTHLRPFRQPHHTASPASIIGGGALAKPGEISLAHRGVLLLDELPEYARQVIEALRQPLEDKIITVSRVQHSVRFPARFILVATMNPCPCGWLDDPKHECSCSAGDIAKYRKKVSGPILDRIDLTMIVPSVSYHELQRTSTPAKQYSESCQQVKECRSLQLKRQKTLNADLGPKDLHRYATLGGEADRYLERVSHALGLTSRGVHRLIKVARTIADLSARPSLEVSDIAEAAQYRMWQ